MLLMICNSLMYIFFLLFYNNTQTFWIRNTYIVLMENERLLQKIQQKYPEHKDLCSTLSKKIYLNMIDIKRERKKIIKQMV